MKATCFCLVLCLCGPLSAATFTLTTTPVIPLVPGGIAGNIAFTISHTYDDSNLNDNDPDIIDWDYSFIADDLVRQHTADVQIVPPIFPDPPVLEQRTVTETIRILSWRATIPGGGLIFPLEFDESLNAFRFGFNYSTNVAPDNPFVDDRAKILVERTLVGPLSTRVDTFFAEPERNGNFIGGEVWNAQIAGVWVPQTDYLSGNMPTSPRVHATVHDGVPIPSLSLNSRAIVVPETTSGLLLMAQMLLCRCLRSLGRSGGRQSMGAC